MRIYKTKILYLSLSFENDNYLFFYMKENINYTLPFIMPALSDDYFKFMTS